jgi:hypothetical protein
VQESEGGMIKEKQIIDEMAVIMREAYLKECIHPDCHSCEMYNHDERHNGLCKEKYRAEALYNAGYRKQINAVWVARRCEFTDGSQMVEDYYCSNCFYEEGDNDKQFCPNCGASMKGGAE